MPRFASRSEVLVVALAAFVGCSSKTDPPPAGAGGGGAAAGAGGSLAMAGGSPGSGGSPGTGGVAAGGTPGLGGSPGAGGEMAGGPTTARALAMKLGRPGNFLIGMGNDLANDHNQDGAYTLGVTLDLHDAYLVGLQGKGGWPDWNPGGSFVNILADTAAAHGVVPMFTLYAFAVGGENMSKDLVDTDYMQRWWAGARLLFERIAAFGKPAVVHLEPDFWAFMQQAAHGDATTFKALVKMVPDCAELPDTLAGLGQCVVRLAHKVAPQVAVGFHASDWAGPPEETVRFLNALGAMSSDFVGIGPLDRDAGCFEAHAPECQRGGTFYWDETNQTHPNFHDHLAFAKTISTGTGKPILWWQVPFGAPSDTPGGTPGHYRDNRVHYLFSHIDEFIAAGFVGAAFGVGAGNQTFPTSDGGQFKAAIGKYFAAPVPLP
jgi:hypothetical protein